MKILCLSDTHGRIKNACKIIDLYKDKINTVFHMGDVVRDVEELKEICVNFPITG